MKRRIVLGLFALLATIAHAQTLQQNVATLVANERAAQQQKPPYLYTSIERSDRTNHHEWTERVADIPEGRLRYLISEDGHPLSPERQQREDNRLKAIANNPTSFIREELARKNDEQHAQQMLELLPKAFLLDAPGYDGPWLHINFRPNPDYKPQNYEERILHGMSGFMLIDDKALRLHHLEGQLPADISIALGLATIRSGSSFQTNRDQIAPGYWKTVNIDTNIEGRAIFFKTVARKQHSIHKDFQRLPDHPNIPQVVDLLIHPK